MTDDNILFINNMFWTLQGEGANWGRRSLFVRMPHCNLSCSWCDTEFKTHQKIPVGQLIAFANQEPARFAVVTGGEPLMHRHTPTVVATLKALGFEVAVETNGTMPPKCDFDFVTCSPKADAKFHVHPDLWPKVSEFKYVVDKVFDFSILDRHDDGQNYRRTLSPEFGDFADNVARIVAYIKEHPAWRMSLQTHKWAGLP